mgnify:FL=1
MLLEIPSQIGLAGKVQVVRYLLHGHFRGTQQHLCLQYDMPVYNVSPLARHLPGDSGEITGRDTKLVRIERDLFLVEIMGMDAIDELMEQLLPTVAPICWRLEKEYLVLSYILRKKHCNWFFTIISRYTLFRSM